MRAKAKIRDARIPYRSALAADLPDRLDAVLRVVYLVFNEGYSASSGASLTRHDLSGEAIRLGRLLVELLPEPEALGPAGADAAARFAPRRAHVADGRAGAAGRPGPLALEPRLRSRKARRWWSGRLAAPQVGPLHDASGDRRRARRGADAAATDWAQIVGAVRPAAAGGAVAGDRAEPRGGGGDARRSGGGPRADRRHPRDAAILRTITSPTPRGPTSAGGWDEQPKPESLMSAPSPSRSRSRSGAFCSVG